MANIIKRVWNQNRMVQIEDLKGMTFQAEAAGHTFQISGIDDEGNTVALTGTPSGVLLRPDNTDVALTCSVSGGVVSATLPANCYDVPGRFGLTIFITSGSSKTAIYAAVGTVTRTSSGTVAPGTSQSVVDLINAINAAVNSIPASYSALLADIAPTYSNSALYSVGQYAWYDGDLKRCIVPITTAESYTAAHWTSAVLGQDVSDLKSAYSTFRGSLSGANPITSEVKLGTYSSRKNSDSTGYPDDMYTTDYCIIQYLSLGSTNRYFVLYDVRTGEIWFYDNSEYKKQALSDNAFQHRLSLASDDNPLTANVKIGAYGGQKTSTTVGYPEDMTVNHYCIIVYYAIGGAYRYFSLYDVTTGDEWFWGGQSYTKQAKADSVTNIQNNYFTYRGALSGADPLTYSVKVGTYASRKNSDSTGYPEDMTTLHYCIIQYLSLGSTNRYFVLYDVDSGDTWLYTSTKYIKLATQNEMRASILDAVLIPDSDVKSPEVLKNQYFANGTEVEFTSNAYKSISRTNGSIVSLDETTANAHWKVSDPIPATAGQYFVLNLYMSYNNGIFAFYNESDQALKVIPASVGTASGNKYTITNYITVAPEGTSYVRVGYYDTVAVHVDLVDAFGLQPHTLLGKKWAFIGDSLSDPRPTRASKKYYDYVAERTGITFVNLGVSGTGYVNDYNGAGTFITRVPSIPDDTDVVTIFGSGNDMNYRPGGSGTAVIPIGTAEDTTNETVMGNVYLTIQAIFSQKPNVLLGIMAPTPWVQYPPYTDGNKMLTFTTELEKLCHKYSIPFLDLYHESNLRPWEEWFRQHYYSKDDGNGVHPDEEGNKRFAPLVQDFLERIVLSK